MDTWSAAQPACVNAALRPRLQTIHLSRRTYEVLWQNIALALGIEVVFLRLAIFDNASMWMAVFADIEASLLVVFNELRLLGNAGNQKTPDSATHADRVAACSP